MNIVFAFYLFCVGLDLIYHSLFETHNIVFTKLLTNQYDILKILSYDTSPFLFETVNIVFGFHLFA